jgi:hypothetical protein
MEYWNDGRMGRRGRQKTEYKKTGDRRRTSEYWNTEMME